jgi:hypothetical protein
VHLAFLLFTLLSQVTFDVILGVTLSAKETSECLHVSSHFVPF